MARRTAGVGEAGKIGLAYEEILHIIAQDLGRPTDWVERHYPAGRALRYLRMSEYHPHPLRALVAAMTRGTDG